MLESTNEDETWRYIRSRLDPSKKCLGLTPIVHKEALRTESASVNETGIDHGTELHEEATGYCQDPVYWHRYAAELPRLEHYQHMNRSSANYRYDAKNINREMRQCRASAHAALPHRPTASSDEHRLSLSHAPPRRSGTAGRRRGRVCGIG